MKRAWFLMSLVVLTIAGCGGGAKTIQVFVPSAIVLKEYGTIGIIDFTSNSDASVNRYATRIFQEHIQSAQPGVPFLELGTQRDVLAAVGATEFNSQTISKIGEHYKVDAVFIGDLIYSKVKTDFDMSQMLNLNASVKTYMEASLSVKLNLARNGATVWSNSSSFKRTLSKLRVSKGSYPSFNLNDDDAQRKILPDMVYEITCDFRGKYVRQRVQ